MSVTVASVLELIPLKFDSYSEAEANWEIMLAAAVRFYSQHNPRVMYTSFETVKDQEVYTPVFDFDEILEVNWTPTTAVTSTTLTTALSTIATPKWEVSLHVIARIQDVDNFKGAWLMRDRKIILEPIPAASEIDVQVIYGLAHALNAEETAYETIPAWDMESVVDLTLAEILEREANNAAVEPDYSEGQQRVSNRFRAMAAANRVESLRGKFTRRFARDVAVLA